MARTVGLIEEPKKIKETIEEPIVEEEVAEEVIEEPVIEEPIVEKKGKK
ncbi:MAG: hypothetical protein IKO78_02675 [Bacilli bacterium]|nr:hypothetical protein [Bacilli bacterium]